MPVYDLFDKLVRCVHASKRSPSFMSTLIGATIQIISEIKDRQKVLEIVKALGNAKNLYNLIRFFGHYELLDKIDFKPILVNEEKRFLPAAEKMHSLVGFMSIFKKEEGNTVFKLKDLTKNKKSLVQYKGVNDKILAKKAPSEKTVKAEKPSSSSSPLGKVTNPDPRKGK